MAKTADPMEAYYNELVTIELFLGEGKYADDVFVGWNDKSYQIKRGVPVTVPRGVAEIIANGQKQDKNAANYIMKMSSASQRIN